MTALVIPEWTRGDKMRKAREAKGIGVSEMAALLVRTRSTIRNYESDSTKPPASVLSRWAELCEVPMEWLDDNMAHSYFGTLSSPADQLLLLDDATRPLFDFTQRANVFPLRRAS